MLSLGYLFSQITTALLVTSFPVFFTAFSPAYVVTGPTRAPPPRTAIVVSMYYCEEAGSEHKPKCVNYTVVRFSLSVEGYFSGFGVSFLWPRRCLTAWYPTQGKRPPTTTSIIDPTKNKTP